MKKAWAYILPTLLCFVLGGLVGWWQNDAIREWYPHLVKPALTPPNAAFPIAWSIIYLCMGLSAGLVLTSASPLRRRVMTLWFAQLGFNVLWSILFFVCRSPLLGMIDIALLDILVAAYIAQSGKIRAGAAWLFVPYLCWILFATYLNAGILAETGLTASAGISVNKMLAKIASDYRKPDGLFTIPPGQIEEFVAALPIERFFGIGEVTARKMHGMGIHTGADLRLRDEAELVRHFGKAGHSYYGYARGIDEREVTPNRIRKSLGAETTFAEDTDDREQLRLELSAVREEVWNRLMRHEFKGKTVVLKLKFDNFRQITRSKTLFAPVNSAETLRQVSEELLAAVDFRGRKIRLIGLTVGNSPEACAECVQLRFDFGESARNV